MFSQSENLPKPISAGAPARTPLESLTVLPQTPNWTPSYLLPIRLERGPCQRSGPPRAPKGFDGFGHDGPTFVVKLSGARPDATSYSH